MSALKDAALVEVRAAVEDVVRRSPRPFEQVVAEIASAACEVVGTVVAEREELARLLRDTASDRDHHGDTLRDLCRVLREALDSDTEDAVEHLGSTARQLLRQLVAQRDDLRADRDRLRRGVRELAEGRHPDGGAPRVWLDGDDEPLEDDLVLRDCDGDSWERRGELWHCVRYAGNRIHPNDVTLGHPWARVLRYAPLVEGGGA